MEQYFDGVMPDAESLKRRLLARGIASGSVIPVMPVHVGDNRRRSGRIAWTLLSSSRTGAADIERTMTDADGKR